MVDALLTIILLPIAFGVVAVNAFVIAVAVKTYKIHKRRTKEENLI